MKDLTARHTPKLSAVSVPLDVIRKLWATADDGEKVFLSLALNCALKSKEISDLLQSGLVDGYLSHTRVKTGVPSVWKLWAVTLELIQRTSNGTKRIFEHNGKGLNDVGEGGHGDKIGKMFTRLCKRAGVTGYTFENLRDTSSTIIASKYGESSKEHKALLAHANNDNTKNYNDYNAPINRDILTEATAYLDGHYGLTLEDVNNG
jgi:integrase